MTEILDYLSHHSRLAVKVVLAIAAIAVLLYKIIVSKIKEKINKSKEIITEESASDYLQKGFELYRSGNIGEAVPLLQRGLELDANERCQNDIQYACKILISIYDQDKKEHKALSIARLAVERKAYDNEILEYMIEKYNDMGESSRVDELKKLLKNS